MSNLDYMDKLLDGVEVEWKTLADITLPTSNIKWRDVEHTHLYIDLSSVSIETKKIIETTEVDATNAPSRAQRIIQEGDVIFATTRPTQMRYCLIDDIYSGQIASTGYCVLRPQISKVLPKWILYCIASKRFKSHVENNESGAAYPAISDTKIKAFEIPVPPLNIQAEIIQILDTFTELTAELTAELVARKQQYAYYREQLLTFEEDKVEWKALGEVAEYSKTRISYELLNEENYVGVNNLLQDKAGKEESSHVPTQGNSTKYQDNDILIGNIRPYLKKIWQADCIGGTNGDVLVIHPTDKAVNPRYLYQVLADDNFFNYNMQHAKGAKMPRGDKARIMEYKIPIPSLAEQQRIVTILDKFEALTTSLTEGLPREIELRQQQYEYYRELLLSFPKAEVADHD